MAITYTKDIPDFKDKVKQAADITELETSISQLSGSLVTVQGDIATLAGAVTALDGVVENITEYSTDEKIVGKWVDGSDIYEKTFSDVLPVITDNNFSSTTVDISSLNIKDVIDYDVVIKQIINDLTIFVKTPYLTNAGLQLKSNVDAGNYISVLSNAASYSQCTFYATIRYTKNVE